MGDGGWKTKIVKVQEVAGLKEKTIDPVWEKYFRG